jgi:hypothetical protein
LPRRPLTLNAQEVFETLPLSSAAPRIIRATHGRASLFAPALHSSLRIRALLFSTRTDFAEAQRTAEAKVSRKLDGVD